MRFLVSVRCASASVQAKAADKIAEFVASIMDAAVQTDDAGLVFDAALDESIETIRHAVTAFPVQRTRVWGRVDGVGDSILTRHEVRAIRLRRCLAEFEPEAIVDINIGAAAGIPDVLVAELPYVSVIQAEQIDEAVIAVHAVSRERLDDIQTRLVEVADVAMPYRVPAVDGLHRTEGTQLDLQPSPIDEGAREDNAPAFSGDVVPCIVNLDPGPELDRTITRLLKEEGHVRSRSGMLGALPNQLSLDTMLQLAYACGGYASLRSVLEGETLPATGIEAWLASVARGGRTVTEDDRWHAARIKLDVALAQCLGDASAAPEIAAALRSDILGAAAGPRRLLVDISALVKFDAKSGIQRVVRNILRYLEEALPERYQIVPIAFLDDGRCLHASRFYARFVDLPYDVPDDAIFFPRPGDIFLGLDLSAHIVPVHRSKFEWMRRLGIPIHFVVYDLLPLRRSECFDPRVVDLFRSWYVSVADLADGVLCISRAVADEFADWLDEYRPRRPGALDIGYFHLGADIVEGTPQAADVPPPMVGRRYVLMVSTLEPRKGYVQALAAFEVLWAKGIDLALVIVGKQGWMMEALVERLRRHSELGRRLQWFEGIEDAMLAGLYRHAEVLLSASEGEGFGLPLIEAAQYGVPVLCRDLPVFREIAGDAASYFSGYEPEALADAVERWLETKETRPLRQIVWKTWREATSEFVAAFRAEHPYRRWLWNEDRYLFSGYNSRLQTLVGERSQGDIVTTGREGVLVYGPYASLSAGAYRVLVYGELSGEQADAILVDVVAVEASVQVAAWCVTTSKNDKILEAGFHLSRDVEDLEVRLMVSSNNVVRVSKIEILRDYVASNANCSIENLGNSEERVQ